LVPALGTLWTIGPVTGSGAMIGLAVVFAGAFLPRAWLVVVVLTVIAAVVARAGFGGSSGLETVDGRFEVRTSLWLATGIASGLLLWIAMRVLSALVASLEASYTSAADAYKRETETRRQLDASRQELEELAQVEMVGRLAGGVAHDVNNALAAIFASFDDLAHGVTTSEQRRNVTELESASHHAADLVRDLLWIGRKFPSSRTSIADLDTTVRACLERVARVAPTLTVELALEHDGQIAVSPEHLEQILFGLVVGAHRSGVTRLALTTRGVSDGQIEIAMRAIEANSSPAIRPRAMQVQLSVSAAKQLVGQSGGSLTISDASDRLAVTVCLPRASSDRRSPRDRGRLRTALVVDDEPMVLRRLCQLVARRGYEVTPASSMAEGLALLATNPDLLITDLQLPDGSGEDIAIASFERAPKRPIIVCSGFNADDLRSERLSGAPLTFVAKPFTTTDLEAALPAPTTQ
jgi:two-component system, cell cycle sensor histidine kinase and response regulator CckA